MSNVKISELTSASTPLAGTEEIPIVQSGTTYKTTAQDIANLASGGSDYLVYTALLTHQSGGITVTVLQNTLGTDLTWSNPTNGVLRAVPVSGTPFVTDKNWSSSGSLEASGSPYFATSNISVTFQWVNYKFYFHDGTATGTPYFTNFPLEIRVYP